VLTIDLARVLSMAPPCINCPSRHCFPCRRAIDLRADPQLALRTAQLLNGWRMKFAQPIAGPLRSAVGSRAACYGCWHTAPPRTAAAKSMAVATQSGCAASVFDAKRTSPDWPVVRYARQLSLSETSLNRLVPRLAGVTAFDSDSTAAGVGRLGAAWSTPRGRWPASPASWVSSIGVFFQIFFGAQRHHPIEFRRRHNGG